MTPTTPTWALLVPATPEWLAPRARRLWDRQYRAVKDEVPDWEVRPGQGDHVGLIDREQGSEGTDEAAALELSLELERPVWMLRLWPGRELVRVFERGKKVRDEDASPAEVAERLGVALS